MPNEIVIGSNRASLYDISQKYHVSMSDLYALNPQFQRGTTNGIFNAALEKQKIAAGAGKRDGDYIEQGELIKLPDTVASQPFYFYKSDASIYQREAVLRAVDKARKATPDGQGALTQEQFVAIATKVRGVSAKEAEDLFNELAQETISVADGPATISAREVMDAKAAAIRTADTERAKEARAEEQRRQAAASQAGQASPSGDPAAAVEAEPPEVTAGEAAGVWKQAYSWLGEKRIIQGANGVNRVTFYAAWATPKAGSHPVMQSIGKNVSPRTGAVAYGLAQFFQGFKPGSDPLYTGAKVAEVGVATGLYFNSVVNTLAAKNDPKMFTLMERWLNGQLKGQELTKFVDEVNTLMQKDPKAAESLSFIQKMVYGARKPGQTFAHDVVIKGFTLAMACDVANIATKHGDLMLRAVDSDIGNDPTAAEWAAAGKDAAMSMGKHAPLLYTTVKGRAAIKEGFSQSASLLEKAKGEAKRATYYEDLAKRTAASGDAALARQFELQAKHFSTLETQTRNLAEKVVADSRVLSTKWMRGGFAMMDAAFALKNEADLVQARSEAAALETRLKDLSQGSAEYQQYSRTLDELKFKIRSFEDSRLSNVVNVAAHVTPAALYKDIADLALAIGMPSMEQYREARVKLGLKEIDPDDPLAGMFTTTSPSIYFTQKVIERGVNEIGHESAEDLLYQQRISDSTRALMQAFGTHSLEMLKFYGPIMITPIMPMPMRLLRF